MTEFAPDPGGVFASHTHRRVCGHVPIPTSTLSLDINGLGHRLQESDPEHGLQSVEDLDEVLKDLEADGLIENTEDGWRTTEAGLEELDKEPPEKPSGPPTPAVIAGLE